MKKIKINEDHHNYRVSTQQNRVIVEVNGHCYTFTHEELKEIPVYRYGAKSHIWSEGDYFELEELSLSSSIQSSAGSLSSPMPGKVFKLLKAQGENVSAGETIMILEAMKMEHPIKSPVDGIVSTLHFNEGDIVSGGVELAIVDALS